MRRSLLPFLAAGFSIFAASAQASDGTLDFSGSVYKNTCFVSVNGIEAPAEATVTLPTLSTRTLDSAGKTAGDTLFRMHLRGCSLEGTGVAAFFKQDNFVDGSTGLLKNSGAAPQVRLQLLDALQGTPIPVGDEAQKAQSAHYPVALPGGTAEMLYAVRYYATGAAGSGTVRGAVTYELHYQ